MKFMFLFALLCLKYIYAQTDTQQWQEKYLKRYNYLGASNPDPRMGALIDVKDQFRLAVKMFQKMAGLNQTGEVNADTLKMMEMPRCGVPDLNTKTSITRRRKRYAAIGPAWPKTRLIYKFINFSPDLDSNTIRRDINTAFLMWQNVSALTFNEVSSSQTADIDIIFVRAGHGDGNDFDGPGGTLAHAYFPTHGDAHFDEDEVWTSGQTRGVNLLQVAVHEFGHSLGLGHSEVQGAIMAPYYSGYTANPALHQDDIRGIQQLYGPPRPVSTQRVTQFRMPSTTKPTRPSGAATTKPASRATGLCSSTPIDAIYSLASSIFIFKGDKFYVMNSPVTGSAATYNTKDYFLGVPNNIDAAVYVSSVPWYAAGIYEEGDIVFFKDYNLWRFTYSSRTNTIVANQANPRPISADFRGLPTPIDSAFVWSSNGKLYFTKDGSYYGYSPNRRAIGSDYPRLMKIWQGVPGKLAAAFAYTSRYTNARTYFFAGDQVYKFDDTQMKVDAGFPMKASWFFGCTDSPKAGSQIASSATSSSIAGAVLLLFVILPLYKIAV